MAKHWRIMQGDEAFFGLEPYHLLLAVCGAAIMLAYWIPRFFSGREPAASGLLILTGFLGFGFLPGMPEAFDPMERAGFWEIFSEMAVIVALFGTGLRIDRLANYRLWQPTVRLLVIGMPLAILAMVIIGTFVGLTIAGAILLGAVLAPTDPVLAADVQVGPPLEGGEHPVRFTLTTEAGLNDGLAFPFVYLGLIVAAQGLAPSGWLGGWLGYYILYKVVAGAVLGAGAGWLLGKVMFAIPRENALALTGSGVLAFAGVLFTYGATELLEGYGFIAAFAMGLMLRHEESDHKFHKRLHTFSESIEHALTAVLLVMLGGVLPMLWPYMDWPLMAVGLALLLVIRPVTGWLSLIGTDLDGRDRAVVAFYGVRGIGSIYYLGYAASHMELANEGALWATVAFTILASTVIHGLTAGSVVGKATDDP